MDSQIPSKRTNKRFGILALIFVCVIINYMDRSNISIAMPAIKEELGLSTVQVGLLFSAFAWTYAALQIPGGIMVDLIKPRLLYAISLSLWSLATLLQGFTSSFMALIGYRMGIGVFEAPSYPINNRIVTSWFPESERASAIAVYTSGQYIGLAFLAPTLVTIQNFMGWRGLFIVSGLVGIGFAVVWYMIYRDPQDHKTVSKEELDYIEAGNGIIEKKTDTPKKQKLTWNRFKQAFVHRKLWGVYIGQYCIGAFFIFFLTWFPTYLIEYRGLGFIKSGWLASIPFLAAFCGVLLSGFTSDYLIRSGRSAEFARKTPVLAGTLLSTCIIGANYTDSTPLVITFLALAFFGNGLASIAWIFVSTIAPKPMIGLVGGVFNCIGGLSAVTIPVIIGFLVEDGKFEPALFFIGAIAFLGFFSFMFLVGKIERIELKEDTQA